LYKLESALAKSVAHQNAAQLEASLKSLESLNKKLVDIKQTKEFRTIAAFVTFENDDHYETALEWAKYRSHKNDVDAGTSTNTEAEETIVVAHGAHFRHVWIVLFNQTLSHQKI